MNDSSQYFNNIRTELADLLPDRYLKVLEIGCGEGRFRGNLSKKHEYWGVEPVDSAARSAQERLDKVFVGTYEDVKDKIPDDYFDLVICNDVIEHMPDHERFLKSIKEKLRTDGSLMGSIPNVRYISNLWGLLVKKDWQYKSQGILDSTHLRFFTQKSLTRTLGESGYSIEELIGINPYRSKNIFDRFLCLIAVMLLGKDVIYYQLAFRIKNSQPSSGSTLPATNLDEEKK